MPQGRVPPPAPRPRSNSLLWIVLAAVVALLVGAGAGYAIGSAGKSDVTTQRDAAQKQVSTLQNDIAQQKSSSAACTSAATSAETLIGQWENLWTDLGSAGQLTEAQFQHIDNQITEMETQSGQVDAQLQACTSAGK